MGFIVIFLPPRFLVELLALLSRDDLLPEVTLVDAVDMTLLQLYL
jgi:hypothetical protein